MKTSAGNGCPTDCDGIRNHATFKYPDGVAVTRNDEYVIVTDYGNNEIRKLEVLTGVVTTIADGKL
jgi:DNA-binding beta-propeller fold protein YncE